MFRFGLLVCTLLGATAGSVGAQTEPEPIPVFAVDLRAAIPRFKADPLIASGLSVALEDLPTRGLGVVAGPHIYPLRGGGVTFDFGGEFQRTRAAHKKKPA